MKYNKETTRLTVQIINSKTEEVLMEIPNRSWMDVGEIFSDAIVNQLMKQKFNEKLPPNIMVLVVGEYNLK